MIEAVLTSNLIALNYPREVNGSMFTILSGEQKLLTLTGDGGEVELRFRGDMNVLALDREKRPILI